MASVILTFFEKISSTKSKPVVEPLLVTFNLLLSFIVLLFRRTKSGLIFIICFAQ